MNNGVTTISASSAEELKTAVPRIIYPQNCPMFIFLPDHYRDDNSCRCNETICEQDGCTVLKWNGEIYCEEHCGW